MKETLVTLARYNAHANNAVLDILTDLDPLAICNHCGSHYDSILGLLQHILFAEIKIMRKIQEEFPEKTFHYPPYSDNSARIESLIPEGFTATARKLREMDANLITLINSLDEEELQAEVQGFTCPVRGKFILLHIINHGTHHRGTISQVLDEMGVKHDFSGILQSYPTLETI